MGLGTGATAAIVGGIGAAGSIASGVIGADAAGNAASTQANAANNAAALQSQDAQKALDFQKLVFQTQQQNAAPWLRTGTAANTTLANLMGLSLPQTTAVPPTTLPNPDANNFGSFSGGNSLINSTFGNGGNGRFIPMQAQNGAVARFMPSSTPTQDSGQNFEGGPLASNGQPGPGGLMTANGAGVPGMLPNPDANNFGTFNGTAGPPIAANGNPAQITVANGSPGQVPIINPGASPNAAANGFGSLAQGFNEQFQAPNAVTEQNDPGYQFRLNQGLQSLQQSAAARGGLLTGGTAKAVNDYAQNSASGEFGNVYNRALTESQQRYNIFNNNQNTLFNRLASMSGFGQTASAQLNSAATAAAGNNSNILLTSGQQIGNNINNAGAANASGYVGSANAVNGAINGIGGLASIYSLLNKPSSVGITN